MITGDKKQPHASATVLRLFIYIYSCLYYSIFLITSLKILFRTMNSLKNIRRTKEIFMYKKYIDTTIRSTKTGNRTENRTPDHRENFMCKWTSMTKEIFLHKIFFDMTIRSTKTGNRIENRTPDHPEIFMDEPVWEYKFACTKNFSIGPTMFKWYHIAPRRTTK